MLKELPVGEAVYSLIKDFKKKIFDYVKVKVTLPDNLKIPVLPARIITKGRDKKLVFPSRGAYKNNKK